MIGDTDVQLYADQINNQMSIYTNNELILVWWQSH